MSTNPTLLTQQPAWQALAEHYPQVKDLHLSKLFAVDPGLSERFAT